MQRSSTRRPRDLRSIAVFLASRDGEDASLREMAYEVGAQIAERGIELVYGGGGSGLMGALSRGALDHRGRVYGVIPGFMVEREWARSDEPGLQLEVVGTMHQRKATMAERADAFLVLPGGLGTLEEMFEVWTWQTLGLHAKPLGLLNPAGFWDPLVMMLDRIAEHGFMSRGLVDALVVDTDLPRVLDGLAAQVVAARR
ncbi:TIGR00730 family Rossman fold protein [Mumia sp. zg.B17]|uniref:LOG family protein n=2 Tax=Mumia TaxID=1546255 RepID=UPI001C6ECF89|nr:MULTISPECIES: TIGR00730 family Rossman fold protein [unclassified Mumia]MBW9206674.1 TIGR00730 family Rossman fold protein [Mumia sp. zg.B17]MBW9211036.1 TIGR00730 family Rossman fold protein [Mumia sp. zg.B21]